MIPRVSRLMAMAFLLASLVRPMSISAATAPASPDSLYRRALAFLADGTIESRRLALKQLDEASRMAADRADIQLALGRACADAGQLNRARKCFERVAKLTPDDAEAQLALGLSWKWEWLASTDASSYARAIECLMRAARLSARSLEARLALSALALVKGNVRLGALAAQSAMACDRESPEALLALACASYRAGALPLADSAFRAALPLLSPEVRLRFTDLSAIAGRDSFASSDSTGPSATANGSFWRMHDPDLTTSENEAELNYMARVANALLLFRDGKIVRWDMRAELLTRYGIPDTIRLHPADATLEFYVARRVTNEYLPDEIPIPYNEQIWSYVDLGLRVVMWDRSLTQSYQLPVAYRRSPDPRPDPASVANRPDLVLLGDGRGVYRALAPGVMPMSARAQLSRFPADSGARLVASLEAPGGPADSLSGCWAVVAGDGREVARGSGALSISACAPIERRIVALEAQVPAGDYRVDLAVTDGHGRRGVVHLRAVIAPASGRLVMSDLVLLCGPAAAAAGGSVVRLEPSFDRNVGNARSVSVYFEVDHLAAGPDGQSRFAYTYALRPVPRGDGEGRRPGRAFEASREEQNVGPRRRQFVSAPLQSLHPGTYDFEVEVRDLVSGGQAAGVVRFVKD